MGQAGWIRIGSAADLRTRRTLTFQFKREGISVNAFAAKVEDRWVAYENVCRHIPISLDYGDGEFFSGDGAHFLCQTHGALYDPATGECVRGPCGGASLYALQVECHEGQLWLTSVERRKAGNPPET